ncbi:MAG: hypothetical protein ACRD2X_27875 [Vicinamibacteraceae bacterium]
MLASPGTYPATAWERDRFVLDRRPPRLVHDPWKYQGVVVEDERTDAGSIGRTVTVFLTGRECPWRCVMCDLWQHTITGDTPEGAIPAQLSAAWKALRRHQEQVTQVKLYNAGSFFDPRAVPERDYCAIAAELSGVARVIVESHPSLIGPRVDRFLEALDRGPGAGSAPTLEVAMGLETAHPVALERLNKRMTVESFASAAAALRRRNVALRAFLLIAPPFVPPDEQDVWLLRTTEVAFTCGATAVSLIPTRHGNGALDALADQSSFRAPRLTDIERSLELAHAARATAGGRILVDIWDLERFSECEHCFVARRDRLHAMNLEQRCLPPLSCTRRGSAAASC